MPRSVLVSILFAAALLAQVPAENYPVDPASQRQASVPQGKVTTHQFLQSKVFPGTTHDYYVYVPAQYDPAKPAALMVFQDGKGYRSETGNYKVPVVFDNLIASGEMPVTIAVFVDPGVLPPIRPDAQARYNRSFEYDNIGDRYSRFLIEELLPEISKSFNITTNPNLRGIVGASSGAVAALVTAWHRPDQFRRVYSTIGSFVNIRGAHAFPEMVRKTEPKPLKIFLQTGRNDLNIYTGDWHKANLELQTALDYAGYSNKMVIGDGAHNGKHGGALLPEAMRWLWKDSDKPITNLSPTVERHMVKDILDPASAWQVVGEGYKFTEGPTVDRDGNVAFTDARDNKLYKIDVNGKVSLLNDNPGTVSGMMYAPDGRLYACRHLPHQIVAFDAAGKTEVLVDSVNANDIAITKDGGFYFTEPRGKRVWYRSPAGDLKTVAEGLGFANGVLLSADQSLVFVADSDAKFVWSYQRAADDSLINGQMFYRLDSPEEPITARADGLTTDTEGYLYVATNLGLQIFDQPGRLVGILPKVHNAPFANVVFGGADLQWLYVTHGDKVYRRHTRRKGVTPWTVIKPPQPRL
jgi:gluconolactonase